VGRVRPVSATPSFGGAAAAPAEFAAGSSWRSPAAAGGDAPSALAAVPPAAESGPAAEVSPAADGEHAAASYAAAPATAGTVTAGMAESVAEGPAPADRGPAPGDHGVPPPRAAEAPAMPGPDGQDSSLTATRAGAGWLPDSASTRRRSVVFEEDDDLDVPDFLK
jgi:cell division protein FtsZ